MAPGGSFCIQPPPALLPRPALPPPGSDESFLSPERYRCRLKTNPPRSTPTMSHIGEIMPLYDHSGFPPKQRLASRRRKKPSGSSHSCPFSGWYPRPSGRTRIPGNCRRSCCSSAPFRALKREYGRAALRTFCGLPRLISAVMADHPSPHMLGQARRSGALYHIAAGSAGHKPCISSSVK